jgi:hypothetical protein
VNVLFGSFPFTTWRLEFAPPAGQTLQVGRYPDAVMPGYQQPGQAGLYVSGPGGCSQIHASFDIKELTRTASGAIESFWHGSLSTATSRPALSKVKYASM